MERKANHPSDHWQEGVKTLNHQRSGHGVKVAGFTLSPHKNANPTSTAVIVFFDLCPFTAETADETSFKIALPTCISCFSSSDVKMDLDSRMTGVVGDWLKIPLYLPAFQEWREEDSYFRYCPSFFFSMFQCLILDTIYCFCPQFSFPVYSFFLHRQFFSHDNVLSLDILPVVFC